MVHLSPIDFHTLNRQENALTFLGKYHEPKPDGCYIEWVYWRALVLTTLATPRKPSTKAPQYPCEFCTNFKDVTNWKICFCSLTHLSTLNSTIPENGFLITLVELSQNALFQIHYIHAIPEKSSTTPWPHDVQPRRHVCAMTNDGLWGKPKEMRLQKLWSFLPTLNLIILIISFWCLDFVNPASIYGPSSFLSSSYPPQKHLHQPAEKFAAAKQNKVRRVVRQVSLWIAPLAG